MFLLKKISCFIQKKIPFFRLDFEYSNRESSDHHTNKFGHKERVQISVNFHIKYSSTRKLSFITNHHLLSSDEAPRLSASSYLFEDYMKTVTKKNMGILI